MDMAFRTFENREKLAEALATGVAAVLAGGNATTGSAVLAVSGGNTPARFFERLSKADIDWKRVTVILVDERFVPPSHERSNAGMVAKTLLQDRAAAAKFVPMVTKASDFASNLAALEKAIALVGPIDACILGMGTDGHTASFFPGGDHLSEAIDRNGEHQVISMNAPGAGERRLTLTLPRILDSHFIALHIEGLEKKSVYENALRDGPAEDLPVRTVLRAAKDRLQIFWAP
jgi:6-phosphogluconolactonase